MSQYDYVLSRLYEAGDASLRAPDPRLARSAQVLADRWRPVADSLVERSGFLLVAELEWPHPSKDRILKMAEVFVWLAENLREDDQQIVVAMTTIPPGANEPILSRRILAAGLRITEAKLLQRFDRAVETIAQRVWIEAEAA